MGSDIEKRTAWHEIPDFMGEPALNALLGAQRQIRHSVNCPLLIGQGNVRAENRFNPGVVDSDAVRYGLQAINGAGKSGRGGCLVYHESAVFANDPFLGPQVRDCSGTRYIATVIGSNIYWIMA